MLGVLGSILKVAPAVITVARKAPAVIGMVTDLVRGGKKIVKPDPETEPEIPFAESALMVLAYAAAQFKTSDRAFEAGKEHGGTISETMAARVPGWEVAEDQGLIPYLTGLIRGLQSDG